jgi:hypothetical protein
MTTHSLSTRLERDKRLFADRESEESQEKERERAKHAEERYDFNPILSFFLCLTTTIFI